MATRKIGTRGKPTSPLHLGVSDPEHILKEARKIQRCLSSPSLFTLGQLESASSFTYFELKTKEGKQNISWLVPSTPVETFQILTTPLSIQKTKTEVPCKTPLFQFKPYKLFSRPSPSKVIQPFYSLKQSSFTMEA